MITRRIGVLALLVGFAAGGASLEACAGPSDDNASDDGGNAGDGAAADGRHDGAAGDSGGHDGGGHDGSTADAADGASNDGADGAGDDASEGGGDASEAGDDGGGDGSDGGGDDASDADAGDDGGRGDDGGDASDGSVVIDASDAGGGDAMAPVGEIFFENIPAQNQGAFYAAFYDSQQALNGGCTTTAYGACTYYDCSNPADAGAPVSAGSVTASGGVLGGGVTLLPQMDGTYQYQPNASLFSQGNTMGVSATGGTIPAFATVSVVATGLEVVTAPVPNMQGNYVISTSQDLALSWSGGEANAQAIFEVSASFGQGSHVAECFFDATLGSASIPKAALANLFGGGQPVFLWGQWRETDFTAGSYPLRSVAVQLGFGTATLQ